MFLAQSEQALNSWVEDVGKLIVLFSLCKQCFPTPSPAQPVSSVLPDKRPFPSLNDGDTGEGWRDDEGVASRSRATLEGYRTDAQGTVQVEASSCWISVLGIV